MFTTEIWKKAKGYENFEVSSIGRIKNKALNLIKKQRTSKNGYLIVTLKENGIQHTEYVHRLVAKAFIDNPHNLPAVNHIDENRQNNRVENLEWCDTRYNNCFAGRAIRIGEHHKKHSPLRKQIRNADTGEMFPSVREAARQTGVSCTAILACLNGKQKHAAGKRWEVV